MYNSRNSNELNRVDALRCAVATVSALDKRLLRGKNIAQVVIAIAASYEAWLNGSPTGMPEDATWLIEPQGASGKG